MFCGKCGAQLPEGSLFCSECGTKIDGVEGAASAAYDVQANTSANKKNRLVGIAVVAVAALLVVILCVFLFGGRSYESVIKTYVTAQFEGDAKSVIALFPDEFLEMILEETDMTEKEFIAEANDELESMLDQLDDRYDNWTYSYEITDVDDLTSKKIKSMNEDIEDYTDFTITEAKTVTVEFTIIGDEDEFTTSVDVIVTKVGRSWYLLTMDGIF